MGLHGKLVAAVEFRAGGDVYHELFTQKQKHVSTASPAKVQDCELHEGEYGKVGSKICWKYTHDGKEKSSKQVIQEVDDEKKKIVFKLLEGDLMEEYKDFVISLHIETIKDGSVDLVTWTLDYETLNDQVDHPISLLNYFIDLTKDIESHHLKA